MTARSSLITNSSWLLAAAALVISSGCCPARNAQQRLQCGNNLKQIGLAMHQYNMMHGSFPPAYVADDDGQPLYSWRVLLLPYLEQSNLYEAFDKEQPWDSPQNISLVDHAPPPYQCPSARREDATFTDYSVVVGPETLFPGEQALPISSVVDGTTTTIMAIEIRDSTTHWAEPSDMTMEELLSRDRSDETNHYDGRNVLMADGSVHFIPESASAESLRAMVTRSGDEKVDLP